MGWHVTVKVAHENPLPLRWTRVGYCSSLAALLIFFGCESLQNATAEGETRTISFHHSHTNEDLTITYKVNGRYDETALTKIDSLLRDWREDKPIRMDPHLIDLLWEVHREIGAKEPIWIICGYRSPSTNASLRRHSSGVAKFSQHMNGKAIDFYIPGVPLDQLRAAGLRAQRGGVGYYPSSGSPFVHLDTGNARHWPRMPEAQLANVLSKGQLGSRFASDTRGTALAKGEIQRPNRAPGLLAKLSGGGKDADEEADAAAAASTPAPAKTTDSARTAKVEPKSEKTPEKAAEKPAVAARAPEPRSAKIAAVPMPPARPLKTETYQVASATSKSVAKLEADNEIAKEAAVVASKSIPAPVGYEMASASAKPVRLAQAGNLPDQANATANNAAANDVINERGYWQGLPSAEPVEVPINNSRVTPASTPTPRRAVATASADPAMTASITRWPLADRSESDPMPNALAYASQPTPIAAARAVPMGTGMPRAAPAAQGDTTIVVKRSDDRLPDMAAKDMAPKNDDQSSVMASKKLNSSVVRVGDRFNDPWLRAMIVSPSAQSFMKTTQYGAPDFRNFGTYMQKPATALAMTFTDDPHPGMASEKFTGSAVTFISSVKFSAPRTTTVR
jgi:uncharacterized protein YcbK (DUF882 family)